VTSVARKLVVTRAMRGFADGAVSVLLASYLSELGYTPFEVGAIVTGTLLGSAALTLAVGLVAHRFDRRRVLLSASALMLLTGVGFFATRAFVPLLLVAIVGTLNPSAGDVSLFLPLEQAALSDAVAGSERTSAFAKYNVAGGVGGAIGALASGLPVLAAKRFDLPLANALRFGFVAYSAIAIAVALVYSTFPRASAHASIAPAAPLAKSRAIVIKLAALFSLDSAGGGFVVQSLLVLWLFRRFSLSIEAAGEIFFVSGLFAALSQFGSAWLARRIGLINTMVFTHLPANALLVVAAFMPTAPLAVGFLLARMLLSSMDVPARQSYVMAVVPPEERAAAASVTNVPRSLASAATPLLAGMMLERTNFGWPLIFAGVSKAIYDLLLLHQFRSVKPPEE